MSDSVREPDAAPGPLGAALLRLSVVLAATGGLLLLSAAVLTVVSVTGRQFPSLGPVPGDVELVELAMAAAIASFLPYCQMRRGHVIVDFVTGFLPAGAKAALDALAAFAFMAVAGLFAWRLALGGMDMLAYNDQTMVLGVPTWPAFAVMVPSFALLAVTCLHTGVTRLVRPER